MFTNSKKYDKLINEADKMIKFFSNSIKSVDFEKIKYLIFHRNGICSAIQDHSVTSGEMLVLSRFINIVINNNIIEIIDLKEKDIIKLLESLLRAIPIQNNVYFTTTVFVVLTQENMIRFMFQNNELLQIILEWLKNNSTETVNLITSTMSSLLQYTFKQLECISESETMVNNTTLSLSREITMYTLHYSLMYVSVTREGIQHIIDGLNEITILSRNDKTGFETLDKDFCVNLVHQLKTNNNLNEIWMNVNILRSLMPHIADNFCYPDVVSQFCKISMHLLSRSTSIKECVLIIEMIDDAVLYIVDNEFKHILSNKIIIKQLMGFIRILPMSGKHSDTRNKLWWRLLCNMDIKIFQAKYTKYLLPLLENLMGVHLDDSSKNYYLSRYTVKKGYMESSSLACHVFTNLIDCLDLQNRFCQIELERDQRYEIMSQNMFNFPDQTLTEFRQLINEALLKWCCLIKRTILTRPRPYGSFFKRQSDGETSNWNIEKPVPNKKCKQVSLEEPHTSKTISKISDYPIFTKPTISESSSHSLAQVDLDSQLSLIGSNCNLKYYSPIEVLCGQTSCPSEPKSAQTEENPSKKTEKPEKKTLSEAEAQVNDNAFLVPTKSKPNSFNPSGLDSYVVNLSDETEPANINSVMNMGYISNSLREITPTSLVPQPAIPRPVKQKSPRNKKSPQVKGQKGTRNLSGKIPKSKMDISFNILESTDSKSPKDKAEIKLHFDLDAFKNISSKFTKEDNSKCNCKK